jgi:alkylated DNA repair dioxygenase AlkB
MTFPAQQLQGDLFGPARGLSWPDGFSYAEEVISRAGEAAALEEMRRLPFREFQFHGFEGKRRVVSFGWRYDFSAQVLFEAEPVPPFLLALRAAAARTAGFDIANLAQVLVTEYAPGAGIGWHRDRPVFGEVLGLSLGSACTFRLRRKHGDRWLRTSMAAAPRSAYRLMGEARSLWEHSIPPVDSLRYSVTFRNFREGYAPGKKPA